MHESILPKNPQLQCAEHPVCCAQGAMCSLQTVCSVCSFCRLHSVQDAVCRLCNVLSAACKLLPCAVCTMDTAYSVQSTDCTVCKCAVCRVGSAWRAKCARHRLVSAGCILWFVQTAQCAMRRVCSMPTPLNVFARCAIPPHTPCGVHLARCAVHRVPTLLTAQCAHPLAH